MEQARRLATKICMLKLVFEKKKTVFFQTMFFIVEKKKTFFYQDFVFFFKNFFLMSLFYF